MMELFLTYCSSEEGIRLVKLFKYLKRKSSFRKEYREIDLHDYKDESADVELLILPADRKIIGYENIRQALKSIFPDLMDLTVTRRKSLISTNLQKKFHGRSVRSAALR